MAKRFIVWLMLYSCTITAAAGAIWFVGDINANNWIEPAIAPPALIFGPVWTILYALIATSGYRILYSKPHKSKELAISLWAIQICLNTLWTPVFFGAYDLTGALIIIVILWLAIAAFVAVSFKIDRTASCLFMPYWAWVSFAAVLNYSYIVVNPIN